MYAACPIYRTQKKNEKKRNFLSASFRVFSFQRFLLDTLYWTCSSLPGGAGVEALDDRGDVAEDAGVHQG